MGRSRLVCTFLMCRLACCSIPNPTAGRLMENFNKSRFMHSKSIKERLFAQKKAQKARSTWLYSNRKYRYRYGMKRKKKPAQTCAVFIFSMTVFSLFCKTRGRIRVINSNLDPYSDPDDSGSAVGTVQAGITFYWHFLRVAGAAHF